MDSSSSRSSQMMTSGRKPRIWNPRPLAEICAPFFSIIWSSVHFSDSMSPKSRIKSSLSSNSVRMNLKIRFERAMVAETIITSFFLAYKTTHKGKKKEQTNDLANPLGAWISNLVIFSGSSELRSSKNPMISLWKSGVRLSRCFLRYISTKPNKLSFPRRILFWEARVSSSWSISCLVIFSVVRVLFYLFLEDYDLPAGNEGFFHRPQSTYNLVLLYFTRM